MVSSRKAYKVKSCHGYKITESWKTHREKKDSERTEKFVVPMIMKVFRFAVENHHIDYDQTVKLGI